MVRLNVEAVIDLTGRFVPRDGRARPAAPSINIASTAAFQPMPGTATYAATKSFVLSQSEALHRSSRAPGSASPPSAPARCGPSSSRSPASDELTGSAPDFVWSAAEEIATAAVEGVEAGKRMVVPGAINRATALAGHLVPTRLMLGAIDRGWNR